jgi:hypothetical protein
MYSRSQKLIKVDLTIFVYVDGTDDMLSLLLVTDAYLFQNQFDLLIFQ